MCKFFWLFFYTIVCLNCKTNLPGHLSEAKIKPNFSEDHIPVVFVPGIKGSILKDKSGDVRWLSASQALGFKTPDLKLVGESIDLVPAGAIERVTAIPKIIDVDLYGPWLEEMSEVKGVDFYVFSYDWRKDNLNTRDKLISFLMEINAKYKSKAVLIGHSMGGMLSFSAVNKEAKLVDKLVLVGVPFQGGIGYMKDLYIGNSTGFNSKIQGPCMIAKYESVYGFFPRIGSKDSRGLVLDANRQILEIDFFEPKTWQENAFGFWGQKCKNEEVPSDLEFQNILFRAKLFRESLDISSQLKKSQPKTLIIHANNRPTRKAIKETSQGKKWDLEAIPKEPGDGSVLFEHSIPQPGLIYETLLTENEHSVMLNDQNVQKKIMQWIQKESASRISD